MARNGRMAVHGQDPHDTAIPALTGATGPLQGGVEAARIIIGSSLGVAQDFVDWAALLQRQQARFASAWNDAVDGALSQSQHAGDLQSLMSLSAEFADRQMGLVWQQLGEVVSLAMDKEMQLASRWRDEATVLAHRMLTGTAALAPLAAGAGEAADDAALAPLVRLQEQWIAAAQRWIDAATPH